MLLYTRLAPAKIPKKRSRTGCAYCRDKKKKCNEVRPQCARCLEKGQECIYEPVRPRQRRRRSDSPTTTATTTSPPAAPPARRPSPPAKKLHEPLLSRPGAPVPLSALQTSSPKRPVGPLPKTPRVEIPLTATTTTTTTAAAAGCLDVDLAALADLPLDSSNDSIFDAAMLALENMDSSAFAGFETLGLDFDLLGGGGGESPDDGTLDSSSTGSSSNDSPEEAIMASPKVSRDVSMVVREEMPSLSQGLEDSLFGAASAPAPAPTLSYTAPRYMATAAAIMNHYTQPQLCYELGTPAFYEFSDLRNRRALIDHFCNVLSHLLVFKEERGNPFQHLVLPLCRTSLVVGNAMYALASAHLEYRGVEFSETSDFFHRQAITGLAKLIAQGPKAERNELLAAIVLLIYYEVLVLKGRSSIVDDHLRGALTVMSTRYKSPVTRPNPTEQFLGRAFRFHDVISSLSLGRAPMSLAYMDASESSTESTSSSLRNIDSLLGMFRTLWPILHRLACLQAIKRDLAEALSAKDTATASVLKAEFETGSAAVEIALEEWQPDLPEGCTPADLSIETSTNRATTLQCTPTVLYPTHGRLRSILNNALAYRHSGSVFLYRCIYRCAQDHPLVQRHTHAALVHCMRTVQNAGPMSALLWPLFVAACEARTAEDREFARQSFLALDRRQGMVNIQNAWTIVQEVWKRCDDAKSQEGKGKEDKFDEDLWRVVSNDLGIRVVLG